MYIKFNASSQIAIGVELEIQTVSQKTGELIPGAGVILSQLSGEVLFKPELFNSTIELNTPVCKSVTELEAALQKSIHTIQQVAREYEMEILVSGCHPFANWQQQQITQQERYQNLLRRIQWPVRQFLIFGLHVHVGIREADTAIYVMNRLTSYLPHLIALSASSPFWNGFDTGLATSRIKIFEELPNAGIPYYFKNWESYSQLVEHLIKTNSINTVRDIWWDVRPHPIFGTVEIRVCDAMPTVKENIALSTLIYLLVLKLSRDYRQNVELPQIDRWILEENKWRAARYGIHGEIIAPNGSETLYLVDEINKLYHELLDFSHQPDLTETSKHLSVVPEIIQTGPSYLRQRQWSRQKPGDYKYIVDNLIKETKENKLFIGS